MTARWSEATNRRKAMGYSVFGVHMINGWDYCTVGLSITVNVMTPIVGPILENESHWLSCTTIAQSDSFQSG